MRLSVHFDRVGNEGRTPPLSQKQRGIVITTVAAYAAEILGRTVSLPQLSKLLCEKLGFKHGAIKARLDNGLKVEVNTARRKGTVTVARSKKRNK